MSSNSELIFNLAVEINDDDWKVLENYFNQTKQTYLLGKSKEYRNKYPDIDDRKLAIIKDWNLL